MFKLINSALGITTPEEKRQERLRALRQGMIRHEAKVGGRLFGPVPKGHKREFFCLDKHTWVWHEEWTDRNGEKQVVSTRYDVRPSGVLKSQNGGAYQRLSLEELCRLNDAAVTYRDQIRKEVYNFAS